jgi:uncharacterized protein YigA (DUF484 family)
MDNYQDDVNAVSAHQEVKPQDVALYLRAHPDFFIYYPEILEVLVFPEKKLGQNVLDFQHFALSRLQNNIEKEREKFQELLHSARNNVSVQQQVQQAIKCVVKAKNIDELFTVLIEDFAHIFNVDVVRLAIESDLPELYEQDQSGSASTGVIFLPIGACEELCGQHHSYLSEDISQDFSDIIDTVFSDCLYLVRSCVMLRLQLDAMPHEALLCFGVREVGRYQQGQRVDLLDFLAEIVEERLDVCLKDTGIDAMI